MRTDAATAAVRINWTLATAVLLRHYAVGSGFLERYNRADRPMWIAMITRSVNECALSERDRETDLGTSG